MHIIGSLFQTESNLATGCITCLNKRNYHLQNAATTRQLFGHQQRDGHRAYIVATKSFLRQSKRQRQGSTHD